MKIINKLTFAALAATLLFQTSITRAAGEGRDHRNATVTWTKWITALHPDDGTGNFANIEGIAAGDIGEGTLIGQALTVTPLNDGSGSVALEADYHFTGSKHSFTVHFHAVQKPDLSGVVIGIVTDGWLKGNVVVGEYQGYACPKGVNLRCFDGTFVIKKGSKAKKAKH